VITGFVTSNAEAVISLRVHGQEAQEVQIVAVVDTGFDAQTWDYRGT
jgi:predicted aspartyl protease